MIILNTTFATFPLRCGGIENFSKSFNGFNNSFLFQVFIPVFSRLQTSTKDEAHGAEKLSRSYIK